MTRKLTAAHSLTDAHIGLEARAQMHDQLDTRSRYLMETREAAMAKLTANEPAQQVIAATVQIWGGMCVVREHLLERLYRVVRALRIYEGASEVLQFIIDRDLLRKAAKG